MDGTRRTCATSARDARTDESRKEKIVKLEDAVAQVLHSALTGIGPAIKNRLVAGERPEVIIVTPVDATTYHIDAAHFGRVVRRFTVKITEERYPSLACGHAECVVGLPCRRKVS
jgi:hypothetical protein